MEIFIDLFHSSRGQTAFNADFPSVFFGKKFSLILCVNELILFVNLNQKKGYSIFLASSRTGCFGQSYFCKMEG